MTRKAARAEPRAGGRGAVSAASSTGISGSGVISGVGAGVAGMGIVGAGVTSSTAF